MTPKNEDERDYVCKTDSTFICFEIIIVQSVHFENTNLKVTSSDSISILNKLFYNLNLFTGEWCSIPYSNYFKQSWRSCQIVRLVHTANVQCFWSSAHVWRKSRHRAVGKGANILWLLRLLQQIDLTFTNGHEQRI